MSYTKIAERDAISQFNGMLNEVFGMIKICGYEYEAWRAFKEIDPIAYRQSLLDWLDGENLEIDYDECPF